MILCAVQYPDFVFTLLSVYKGLYEQFSKIKPEIFTTIQKKRRYGKNNNYIHELTQKNSKEGKNNTRTNYTLTPH
jgi:hypothetical protein